jgi:anti-sigma B factor antagonist
MSVLTDIQILNPAGILTAATIPTLLQDFNQCLESKIKIVLIDLSNVDFIDSYGLGMLVSMHAKMRLSNGSLSLCSLKEQARCLFEIADMERVFEIFANQTEFYATVLQTNHEKANQTILL